MSLTETIIPPPSIVKETYANRHVLDSIAKLKHIFADENLSKALSQIDVPGPLTNGTYVDETFAHVDAPVSGATKLKHLLENTDNLIVCPGVYDGLSARAAMEVGFDALYMVSLSQVPRPGNMHLHSTQTGAGTTASRLGMADLAIAQLHDMKEHAEMIANLDPHGPPLIADMDTGYGGKSRPLPPP